MKNEAFFTMLMSKLQSDAKQAETRQFLELDSKSEFSVCKRGFEASNAPKYWRVYQIDFTTVKYDVSAFTGNFLNLKSKSTSVRKNEFS